jgi:hypothetical protein
MPSSLKRTALLLLRALPTPSGVGLLIGALAMIAGQATDTAALFAFGVALVAFSVLWRAVGSEFSARSGLDRANRRNAQLSAELAREQRRTEVLEQRLADANEVVAALTARTDRLDKHLERLDSGVTKVRSELGSFDDRLGGVKKRVDDDHALTETLRVRVARERSQRIVGVANVLTSGNAPDDVVLIHATHRSASTLALEACRSLPGWGLWPSASLWRALGLNGRRFPADLSGGPTGVHEVEVADGQGDLLPSAGEERFSLPRIAVEKFHPEFFGYDVDPFIERVKGLDRSLEGAVSVISLVRDPLQTMWSMAEYKSRNPRWYRNLDPVDIPSLIRDSIESIDRVHEAVGGSIVTYDDITGASPAFASSLASVSGIGTEAVSEQISPRLAPETRNDAAARGFVGDRTADRTPAGPDGVWSDLAEVIAEAQERYDSLLAKRQNSES